MTTSRTSARLLRPFGSYRRGWAARGRSRSPGGSGCTPWAVRASPPPTHVLRGAYIGGSNKPAAVRSHTFSSSTWQGPPSRAPARPRSRDSRPKYCMQRVLLAVVQVGEGAGCLREQHDGCHDQGQQCEQPGARQLHGTARSAASPATVRGSSSCRLRRRTGVRRARPWPGPTLGHPRQSRQASARYPATPQPDRRCP